MKKGVCLPLFTRVYLGVNKRNLLIFNDLWRLVYLFTRFPGKYPFTRISLNTLARADFPRADDGAVFGLKIGKQGKQGKQILSFPTLSNVCGVYQLTEER